MMLQVEVGRLRAARVLKFALLVVAVLSDARPSVAGQTDEGTGPAIHAVGVGIANHIKVAHWAQVRVGVSGKPAPTNAHITVTVPDNDGVPTIASAPLPRPTMPDADRVGTVYTNMGRLGAPVEIALANTNGTVESRTIPGSATGVRSGFVALPATAELLLFFGPMSPALLDSHTAHDPANDRLIRKAVRAESIFDLPDEWIGYDAIDVAVLTVGDGGPFDKYCEMFASDEKRFGAFVRWIELGGRLVIFCAGQNVESVVGEGQPLAALLPGKFVDVVSLPETGRLEYFAGSDVPIASRGAIRVPRLENVDGKIELYEGRQASGLPLVVRAPRGLGEIAFVAINPTKPPFADWPGRKAFVDAVLRPYLEGGQSADATQKLVTRGYNDVSGALRQQLGRSFAGVAPIAFSLVAVIAIAYLLVLGPLDYLLIQRWFKRALAAWITFPIIVLLFGGLALGLAERRHGGGGVRVNQLELVDIDMSSGQARGTVWSAVYSPKADRFDVRLDVELIGDSSGKAEARLHSWALPGTGIGGTQSGGRNLSVDDGYRYGDNHEELIGVPILTSGTKSLLARWTAPVATPVVSELANKDGLVTGSLENRTGRTLRNVRLYYGEWGYRLGTLADGARIDVGEELRPRSLKTIVTQDSLGVANRNQAEEQVFVAERASLREILNVMMFYEAVGGFSFAQLQNRFQADCDLSRMPMLGRAVLVADVETTGSQLVDPESGAAIGEQDSGGVIYRFVLPVRDE
jgi:hypothetical protein